MTNGQRVAAAALLRLVSVVALLVMLVSCLNVVGCCAIDCESHPEACAENERRQSAAAATGFASLAVFGVSLGASFRMRRPSSRG